MSKLSPAQERLMKHAAGPNGQRPGCSVGSKVYRLATARILVAKGLGKLSDEYEVETGYYNQTVTRAWFTLKRKKT